MYQFSFANTDLLIEADWPGNPNPPQFKVKGFPAGENLINIIRRAPIASTTFGAYGKMIMSLQRIKAGDLTFPLLMNAPENKYLQDWANWLQAQADSDGELVIPIQATLVDNMGKDKADCVNGVILAMPAMSRGQTANSVTWVISFEETNFVRAHGSDLDQLGN